MDIPILRASARWKPRRSATTKDHTVIIGARLMTVNLTMRVCKTFPNIERPDQKAWKLSVIHSIQVGEMVSPCEVAFVRCEERNNRKMRTSR